MDRRVLSPEYVGRFCLSGVGCSVQANNPSPSLEVRPTSAQSVSFPNAHTDSRSPSNAELQLRRDKDLIYKHPMFPVLELVFAKCEQANIRDSSQPTNVNAYSSESFNDDIQAFAQQSKRDASLFTSNPEMDNFMIQAVQVLRFHLIELEKVHELCDNFCKRYIDCLKGKMPLDLVLDDGGTKETKSEEFFSDHASESNPSNPGSPQPTTGEWTCPALELPSCSSGQRSSRGSASATVAQRQCPAEAASITQQDSLCEEPQSASSSETMPDSEDSIFHDEDDKEKRKQKKRGIFPKIATNIMKAWLFQHLTHPYPSEDQKRQLASDTGLTILQVNNWFINARRRIVQPMIDASNRAGKSPVVTVYKSRKRKTSGSESISPGPYPYPPMPGHYTTPTYPEHHYGPMYSSYHPDVALPPPPSHYSPHSYGCSTDPHVPAPLLSAGCSQMRPYPINYSAYRAPPTPPQPYLGHPHSSMLTSAGLNTHGYHPSHSSSFSYSSHAYSPHDVLPSHPVMDLHS